MPKVLFLRVSPGLHDELKLIAEFRKMTMNDVAVEMLTAAAEAVEIPIGGLTGEVVAGASEAPDSSPAPSAKHKPSKKKDRK